VPTKMRTILRRNAVPSTSITTCSCCPVTFIDVTFIDSKVLIGFLASQFDARKAEKSWVPVSNCAARCMGSADSEGAMHQVSLHEFCAMSDGGTLVRIRYW